MYPVFSPYSLSRVCCVMMTPADPVPGGCNMEFEVEVSPFLRLSSDSVENRLEFQLARLGWPRGSPRPLPPCDTSIHFINYELYAYHLASDDYSVNEFNNGITLMSNIHSILSKGHRISTPHSWTPKTRLQLLTYPGRGVIFNVVASFGGQKVPYVPISTYNCDLNPTRLDSCGKMNQLLTVLLLSLHAIVALIICFRGHSYFSLQVSWSSFYFSMIIGYILIAEQSQLDEVDREMYSFIIAIVGSLVWTILWKIVGITVISVVTSGLLLGLLLVSTLLFTILGNEDLFRSDFNFWMIIACGSGAVPLILLPFPYLMSIFATSIVGSYAFIFTIDRFTGSSLAYIILNVLKRAAFKQLNTAVNQVPFQSKDVIMSILWTVLAFLGLVFQLHTEAIASANAPRVIAIRVRRSKRSKKRSRSNSARSRSRSRSRTNSRRSQSTSRNGRPSKYKKRESNLTSVVTSTQVTSISTTVNTRSTDDTQPLICHV